jgi:hypothetical protein
LCPSGWRDRVDALAQTFPGVALHRRQPIMMILPPILTGHCGNFLQWNKQ